jgi:VWFA-related protein
MRRRLCQLIILISFMLTTASAQQTNKPITPAPTPTPAEEEIVKIPVTLVQVDVVVRDKNGRPVTDLKAEDFEILEDGRPQTISNFSYISLRSEASVTSAKPSKAELRAPVAPTIPTRVRPDEVRRTIVLVVDNMSFDSLTLARKALRKFVDTQVQPGDLVAILRMGEGMSAFQQFTTDKQLLYTAVDNLRWIPSELYGVNAIPDERGNTERSIAAEETEAENPSEAITGAEEKRFYEQNRLHGKLASISLLVRGIEALPGRKNVFIFSDYFRVFGMLWDGYDNRRAQEELRIVSGQANRALVTLNTIDVQGVQPLNLTASDSLDQSPIFGGGSLKPGTAHPNTTSYGQIAARRHAEFIKAQEGLKELAKRTGGQFSQSNDPAADIADALNNERGYYLLAYTLDDTSPDLASERRGFHKLEVRTKHAGLSIRSRKEYYGTPPREVALRNNQPAQKLLAALTSPYRHEDIGLKLTSLFGNDDKEGSFVRSLLHVVTRDLTFTQEPDGRQKAVVRILVLAFDSNGIVGEPIAQTYTIHVRSENLERVTRDGVIYEMMAPISRPGIYQVRAAVEDIGTGRVGAADQFIDVPDVGAGRLALSGLLVSGKSLAKNGEVELQATSAVRRLRRGVQVGYAFIIYKPQVTRDYQRSQLDARVTVFRDGRSVYTEPLTLPTSADQMGTKQIVMKGSFALGPQFSPGEYILQIVVTDKLADPRYRTATRWMDFEVIE